MILEAFLTLLHDLAVAVFSWAASVLPGAPAFLGDIASGLVTIYGMIPAAVLWFFPISEVVTIGLVVVGVLAVVGIIRLGRRVLSLFTGGGGNA